MLCNECMIETKKNFKIKENIRFGNECKRRKKFKREKKMNLMQI